jgi:hypothetical protein
LSTAGRVGTSGLTIVITHPFHPLRGQSFDAVSFGCSHWGEERVIYRGADGTLPTIAVSMTDAEPPDAFRQIAAGRAAFRMVDLLKLRALLDRIDEQLPEGGDE